MKKIAILIIVLIAFNQYIFANRFYLKLTDEQAEQMIVTGINELFGRQPTKFINYTYFIEDPIYGEKYWCVENYDAYNVTGWITTNYPLLTHYSDEYVSQFISTPNMN